MIDPNAKLSYYNEFVAGAEYTLVRGLDVGVATCTAMSVVCSRMCSSIRSWRLTLGCRARPPRITC